MAAFLFDKDCGFCKKWVAWLRAQTAGEVRYIAYQDRPEEFKEVPTPDLEKAAHFVDNDGSIYRGAPSFFKAMTYRPDGTNLMWMYEKVPGFKPAADAFYRFVAGHRALAAWVSWFLFGEDIVPARYEKVRAVFLRFLAFGYFTAFVSMTVQVSGLFGPNGVFPAEQFLSEVSQSLGVAGGFLIVPSVAWLSASAGALLFYCIAGALFSLALFFGLIPGFSALVVWILYVSLVNIGNVFLGYQWEALLLEAGFLAIFFAPWRWRITHRRVPAARFTFVFLYRWLLFRLIFSSGVVKWISGDPAWHDFTALRYHFETQPLPNPLAWYAHHLPVPVLTTSTAFMFFIEWLVPFFFFFPRRFRLMAFWFEVALQVMILLTGNYAYFNVLTIGLCFFLLDDAALESWAFMLRPKKLEWVPCSRRPWRTATLILTTLLFVSAGLFHLKNFFAGDGIYNRALAPVASLFERYHVMSTYGLFAVMTTVRNEIVIEGSDDQQTWLEYEFKYKPGDVMRAPPVVAPHQPRLDWQAWFAALGRFEDQTWLQNLLVRLLQGQPDVLKLFARVPFTDHPPRYLRVLLYEYRFSDPQTRATAGAWWTRTPKGPYSPVVSLHR